MEIWPNRVVLNEESDPLIEEDFIDADNERICEKLRRSAEAMGLDTDAVVATARTSWRAFTRKGAAPSPFPSSHHQERQVAHRSLIERIKSPARLLLSRMNVVAAGRDISSKLLIESAGANVVVAIQVLNLHVNKAVITARRRDWTTDEM